MANNKYNLICELCGSESVVVATWVTWNKVDQVWEADEPEFTMGSYCRNCGAEDNVAFTDESQRYYWAIGATIVDIYANESEAIKALRAEPFHNIEMENADGQTEMVRVASEDISIVSEKQLETL